VPKILQCQTVIREKLRKALFLVKCWENWHLIELCKTAAFWKYWKSENLANTKSNKTFYLKLKSDIFPNQDGEDSEAKMSWPAKLNFQWGFISLRKICKLIRKKKLKLFSWIRNENKMKIIQIFYDSFRLWYKPGMHNSNLMALGEKT